MRVHHESSRIISIHLCVAGCTSVSRRLFLFVQTYFNIYCVHIKNRVSVSREFGFTFATLCVDCLKNVYADTQNPTAAIQFSAESGFRQSSFRRKVDFDSPLYAKVDFGSPLYAKVDFGSPVSRVAVQFQAVKIHFQMSKSTFVSKIHPSQAPPNPKVDCGSPLSTVKIQFQGVKIHFEVSKSTLRCQNPVSRCQNPL